MQYNLLTDYLDHWAQQSPDTVWLRELKGDSSSEHTWAECRQQVNAVAAALENRFGHGARMLLLSRNCPHWFLADLAIIRSGNVTVPLFTTHPASTAGYIAEFTESTVIFVGESPNWETIRPALPEAIAVVALPGVKIAGDHLTWDQLAAEGAGVTPTYRSNPDDVVSLVFTSGTTGLPKGVIQTHESNLIPIQRAQEFLGFDDVRPRYLSYLPLSHIAERQIVEFSSMHNGGQVSFNESLDHLARDLASTRPEIFFGAPRVWEQLQQAVIGKFGGYEAFDAAMEQDAEGTGALVLDVLGLNEAEFCLTAAAPTPPALIHWWRALGLPLVEGFGQTEAMGVIMSSATVNRIGSVGKPVGGIEVRLTEEGEMIVRGRGTTPGYYNNPEKTDELIRDGWIHTGDKARIDEDGFIYITGRVKDYFKTIQGKFVAPPPIEGRFAESPLVEQQCLMGRGLSKTVMVAVLSEESRAISREAVEAALRKDIGKINQEVEKHARIGALILSKEPWSVENEVLTPTLKIRREKIEERFGEDAARLAREAAERGELLIFWVDH